MQELSLNKIDDLDERQIADVVFVHGIGGDPFTTWAEKGVDNELFWPAWLAKEFPSVQMWTLGYPAAKTRWTNDSSAMALTSRAKSVLQYLADHRLGERPLTFVAYSLGGLVVKQLLRRATDTRSKRLHGMALNTKGIVFLATPHLGSSVATLARFFRLFSRPTRALDELNYNDPFLHDLREWFSEQAIERSWKILAFREDLPIKIGPLEILVVDAASASHLIPGTEPVPVDADHISICRVTSRNSQIYVGIKSFLTEVLPDIQDDSPPESARPQPTIPETSVFFERAEEIQNDSQPESPLPESTIPEISAFFGRVEEIQTLERWILEERCRLVAVLGIAGSGKTTLCAKLASEHQSRLGSDSSSLVGTKTKFDKILWTTLVNRPTATNIVQQLIVAISAHRETHIPLILDDQIALLLDYLRTLRCLCVLDNFESILEPNRTAGEYTRAFGDYSKLLRNIITQSHQSCFLITSREKPRQVARAEGQIVKTLSIEGLDLESSKNIVKSFGNFRGGEQDWSSLVGYCFANPLALELTAKLIKEVFFGEISRFIKEHPRLFTDIKELIAWHFDRLTNDEREILYWMAVEREPVSFLQLKEDLRSESSKNNLASTLSSLQMRMPVEKRPREGTFVLPNGIAEFAIEHLVGLAVAELKCLFSVESADARPSQDFPILQGHALLKATALDDVRDAQENLIVLAILQPLIASWGQLRTKKLLERAVRVFATDDGYAVGNLANLATSVDRDLSAFNFSGLKIKCADFRGVSLRGVDFSNADFDRCVFAEDFSSILTVAFSPFDPEFAAGGTDGRVRFWNLHNGRRVQVTAGDIGWIRCLAFSPVDRKILATGGNDGIVRLWDVESGGCVREIGRHEGQLRSISFSRSGTLLATGGDDCVLNIWNIETSDRVASLTGHTSAIRSVSFSPDDELVVSCSDDCTVKLWDKYQCIQNLQHEKQVRAIAFHPSGTRLVTGGVDCIIRVWELQSGLCIHAQNSGQSWISSLAYAKRRPWLASADGAGVVKIWDSDAKNLLFAFLGHRRLVWTVAFAKDDNLLLSGGDDQTLRIWDLQSGRSIRRLQGSTGWITSVAIQPNTRLLASGGGDCMLKLWNLEDGRLLRVYLGHSDWIAGVAFIHDGNEIVSAGHDGTLKVWGVADGKCYHTIRGHKARIRCLAANGSQVIVTGSDDNSVRVWDQSSFRCVTVIKHRDWIRSLGLSNDGLVLATSSDDRTVRIWDLQSKKCLRILNLEKSRVRAVTFSPDSKILAIGSDDARIELWDTTSWSNLFVLRGHDGAIRTIVFRDDGRTILSGSEDGTIKVWNLEKESCVATLAKHTSWVTSICIQTGTDVFVSGSQDETIRIWRLRRRECVRTLRNRLYENLRVFGATGISDAEREALFSLGADAASHADQLEIQ